MRLEARTSYRVLRTRRRWPPWTWAATLPSGVLLLASCNLFLPAPNNSASSDNSTAPPQILAFSATYAIIVPGAAVTLSWDASNATRVDLAPGFGEMHGSSLRVEPTGTSTFTLTAANSQGTVNASITVQVLAPSSTPSGPYPLSVRSLASGGLLVTWAPTGNESSWVLERMGPFETAYSALSNLPGRQNYFLDTGLSVNETYHYRLHGVNAAGDGPTVESSALSYPGPPEGPSLGVSPAVSLVSIGGQEPLVASKSPVQWEVVEGAAGGSVTSDGLYQAPAGAGTWHVMASDGTVAALATIVSQ
jgi:hypothetical protein